MNAEEVLPPHAVDALDVLPEHMRHGMALYIAFGIEPGSFLRSILVNDLKGACMRADMVNRYAIFDYVSYLYNSAPMPCWGSEEKVDAWTERGGLRGKPSVATT